MGGGAEPRPAGRIALRVRYPETDRMGVVYHAHYLVWFELGRTELLRQLGHDYAMLEERNGLFFPVIHAGVRYRAPARYDDVLTVFTTVGGVGGARVRFDYRLTRATGEGPAETLLADGFTEHAATGRDGRPTRLPAALRRRLAERSVPAAGEVRR